MIFKSTVPILYLFPSFMFTFLLSSRPWSSWLPSGRGRGDGCKSFQVLPWEDYDHTGDDFLLLRICLGCFLFASMYLHIAFSLLVSLSMLHANFTHKCHFSDVAYLFMALFVIPKPCLPTYI